MKLTQDQIDYLHSRGLMPDWVWVQQNGRSPDWNYQYQRDKFLREINEREAAKQREKAKKEMQQQITDAVSSVLQQGSDTIAAATVEDIVSSIEAALNGKPITTQKKSFAADLGAMLGRALVDAPFKLLDDIFDDDERSRR